MSPPITRDLHPPASAQEGGRSLSRRTLLLAAGGIAASALIGNSLLNPDPAAAWGGYGNGQIPASELSTVAGHRFRHDAAASMNSLRAAYQAALGRTLPINDGYRDLAGQQRAWDNYQNGGNLAARPGTSNHGWGIAVDFGGEVYSSSGSAGHRWLQANGAAYGWWWAGRYFSQVENWHWEFSRPYVPPTTTKPIPTMEDDIATQLWLYTPTNHLLLVDHLNMTIRDLGGQNNVERAAFDAYAYRTIGEPQWTQTFSKFKYVTAPA